MPAAVTLLPLEEDPDRYQDVFLNGLSKIANKEEVFRVVTGIFDTKLKECLADFARTSDGELTVLGVGSGEGSHDFHESNVKLYSLQSVYQK